MSRSEKTKARVLGSIARNAGCMTDGLLASDLRLAVETVRRYTAALSKEGSIERSWDGLAWTLTDTARREREIEQTRALT